MSVFRDSSDGPGAVCKHCGSDDIYADGTLTCSAWAEGEVIVGDDGKVRFERQGRPEFDSFDSDFDVEKYVCNACRKSEWKLSDLVVVATSAGTCGRCDHPLAEHELQRGNARRERMYEEFGRSDPERIWAAEMGVSWMSRHGARQAVPPAFTEFLGRQMLEHMTAEAFSVAA